MCIIGLFISFDILFVCFNIFLWRRFARSVLKILSVFLFPNSVQLLVDVSIQSVYYIGIWVIWYACKCPNLPILRNIVILIFVRIIFDEIFLFIHFLFQFHFSENESLFQDLLLFFYLQVFGAHLESIHLFFVLFHFV